MGSQQPNFCPHIWFTGILGIQNTVETRERWFWNDWFNDSTSFPCNWKMVSNGGNASCASLWRSKSPRKSFRRNISREITEVFAYEPAQLGWKQVRIEWWVQTASAETGTALPLFHLQACQNFACQRPNYIHCFLWVSGTSVRLSDVLFLNQCVCQSSGTINTSVTREKAEIQADRQKMNKCNSHRTCCCSTWTKAH